ncbi:MAG: hypothetical protein ACREOH_19995, partial [Candidatus Entotheonellia bacterium]
MCSPPPLAPDLEQCWHEQSLSSPRHDPLEVIAPQARPEVAGSRSAEGYPAGSGLDGPSGFLCFMHAARHG